MKREAHRDAGTLSASCWYDAECFETPGQTQAGDGFVSVSCEETACQCEWRTPGSDPPLRAAFTLDAVPAAADVCRNVLLDRCMIGMRLYSGDAGADAE
jgi:hypothetical protein